VDKQELFKRCIYLSALLQREEFIKERITDKNPEFFEKLLTTMQKYRVLIDKKDDPSKILFRTSGESTIIFIQGLIFPMIDSYYVVLVYILTFVKNKGIDINSCDKNCQWLSELLFKQGSIQYFESCNTVSIKNAIMTFIDQGVLSKQGQYIELHEKYSEEGEGFILDMLE